MADFESNSYTISTTGAHNLAMDGAFVGKFFEFSIAPRTSTNETVVISSDGWQDIGNARKYSKSVFDDGTVRGTRETTSYAITHYKNVSGVLTKIISGSVTSANNGDFDVNFDTVDSGYTIRVKIFA